jgi:hypothetical protein
MVQHDSKNAQSVSPWATGGVIFAATMMITIGAWQIIAGLVAIFDDDFYVVPPNYTFDLDVKTWGWIFLILGIFIFLAALALFAGRTWAIIVAILIATLSAITNFLSIPYYPFWSLLIIAVDVFVIWSLCRVGVARS